MKKILSILIAIMMSVLSAYAQIDIKQFNKVGPEAISALLGNPPEQWEDNLYPDCLILGDEEYIEGVCSFNARIVLDDKNYSLIGFNTNSPNYCVLSDYISGGVKVGDPISKMENYDFVHTKYGRNKDSNAFRLLTSMGETKEYGVFLDEFQFLFFYVSNGIILSIAFGTSEDDPPGYDYTNRLF